MGYLCFWVTHNGVKTINTNTEEITNMKPLNSRKEVRNFICVVHYYRYMWTMWSNMLVPLTKMTSYKRKFKCTKIKQDAFDELKHIVAHNNCLAYPDFNETFKIHTDASNIQLGAFINQKGKPIALYSKKHTDSQKSYTVTEK